MKYYINSITLKNGVRIELMEYQSINEKLVDILERNIDFIELEQIRIIIDKYEFTELGARIFFNENKEVYRRFYLLCNDVFNSNNKKFAKNYNFELIVNGLIYLNKNYDDYLDLIKEFYINNNDKFTKYLDEKVRITQRSNTMKFNLLENSLCNFLWLGSFDNEKNIELQKKGLRIFTEFLNMFDVDEKISFINKNKRNLFMVFKKYQTTLEMNEDVKELIKKYDDKEGFIYLYYYMVMYVFSLNYDLKDLYCYNKEGAFQVEIYEDINNLLDDLKVLREKEKDELLSFFKN